VGYRHASVHPFHCPEEEKRWLFPLSGYSGLGLIIVVFRFIPERFLTIPD